MPGPTTLKYQASPSFLSLGVQNSRIEPGILSHVSDVRMTKNGRKGLIVHECTGAQNREKSKDTR